MQSKSGVCLFVCYDAVKSSRQRRQPGGGVEVWLTVNTVIIIIILYITGRRLQSFGTLHYHNSNAHEVAIVTTGHASLSPYLPSPHPDSAYTGLPFDILSSIASAEVFNFLSMIPPKSCSTDFIPADLIKSCRTVFDRYTGQSLLFRWWYLPPDFQNCCGHSTSQKARFRSGFSSEL